LFRPIRAGETGSLSGGASPHQAMGRGHTFHYSPFTLLLDAPRFPPDG
jgi:hypothetical protein